MDNIIEIRLTKENLKDELLAGDIFIDDPELGEVPVKSARLTNDGYDNAKIYFANGDSDTFGLPQTLRVRRSSTSSGTTTSKDVS